MNTISLQVLLALAMFATTALAGLIPIKLLHLITKRQEEGDRKGRKAAWILTLLSCFAGGVFMGTCFLDIFPHINENYERFLRKSRWELAYPFPQFFVCCGFFLVYLLEELTLKVFATPHGADAGHGHSHGGNSGKIPHGHSHKHRHNSGHCPEEPLSNYNGTSSASAGQHNGEGGGGGKNGMKTSAANGGTTTRSSSIALGGEESDSSIHSSPIRGRSMSMLTHDRIVIDESLKYMASGERMDGTLLKSLTFAIAMSFHSVLEGMALGFQDNNTGILTLFVSLIIHKGIEAFSVGLQITRSNSKRLFMVVLTIVVYALMTPFGSLVGVLITNLDMNELLKEGIIVVLESLAGGTFIYVTFFEVLAQERANDHSNLVQLGAIVLGFLVISAIQVNEAMSEKVVEEASTFELMGN